MLIWQCNLIYLIANMLKVGQGNIIGTKCGLLHISYSYLPVSYRITFKILLMTFKAINGTAPTYIQDMVKIKCNFSRSMRSNEKTLLVTPKVRTETWGARSFYYAAPLLWNQLSTDLRQCASLKWKLIYSVLHFRTLL